MRRWLALFFALGCSTSTTTTGGDPKFDAASVVDAGGDAPRGACATAPTWSALFDGCFGPTAPATCSAQGYCHVEKSARGAQASGFVCGPVGAATKDGCYNGLIDVLVPKGGSDKPTETGLYSILRKQSKPGPPGIMPKDSTFAFSDEELSVIATWIQNGALNN